MKFKLSKPDFGKLKSKVKKLSLKNLKKRFKRPDFTNLKSFLKVKSYGNRRLSLLIAKNELSNYFSTPLAYIILTLFIIIIAIILFASLQFLKFGTAELTQVFTAVSFTFIIIIPALTMGALSKEKQNGTIEYLLTQPITEFQLLLGKFIAYATLVLIMLLLTLPLSLAINFVGTVDFGQSVMQYFGAFVLGLCFVTIGIAASSFFKNEIATFLTSLLISALFIITGTQFFNFFPLEVQSFINKFSLLAHFQSISRGVLDIRDVLYFVAFILVFLAIAYYKIVSEKYPAKDLYLKYSRIFLIVVLIVTLTIGYFGQFIPGRFDATSDKRYTLSQATVDLVNKIPDTFIITLYASSNLPQDFQPVLKSVEDILHDYEFASNGKIAVKIKDPLTDSAAKDDATKAGIKENIFSVSKSDSSQQVVGYFGLQFDYGTNSDIINVTSDLSTQLEFQITKKIKKVAAIDMAKVAFLSNNVKQVRESSYGQLNSDLSELFDLTDLTLDKSNTKIPTDVKALIIAGPNQTFDSTTINTIKNFYKKGGSIFFLSDVLDVDPTGSVQKVTGNLGSLFSDYGVTVNADMAYDLKQNNQIQTGAGLFPVTVDYPFWILSSATKEANTDLPGVDKLSLIWTDSISIDSKKVGNNKVFPLYQTSDASNVLTLPNISVNLDQQFPTKQDDGYRNLVVGIENEKGGRAVIVGDSDFLSNDILSVMQSRGDGQDQLDEAFAISSLEWMTRDTALSTIKLKNRVAESLKIDTQQTVILLGGGVAFPIVLFIAIGAFRFYVRRKESTMVYEFGAGK